jgi:hypothetical protein
MQTLFEFGGTKQFNPDFISSPRPTTYEPATLCRTGTKMDFGSYLLGRRT